MLVASLLEVVSIGAVLPFLGVLTAPEKVFEYDVLQPLIQFLELTNPNQLILPLTIAFISAILLAGIVRLLLLYSTIKMAQFTGSDLSINIYRRTLYQDYSTHINRNSSEVINGVTRKVDLVVGGVISPVIFFISACVMLIGIMLALFAINIIVSLSVLLGFGLIYIGVYFYTRAHLKENSKSIAEESTIRIKSLQEGLGGIRDVLIDGTQEFYCKIFKNADLSMRRATANNRFISASPRYIIEAIGVAVIAGVAYILVQTTDGLTAIPTLGALALGAQRLFPLLQQIYASYTAIKGSKASFEDVIELLEQKLPDYIGKPQSEPMEFNQSIQIQNLSFQYSKTGPQVLKNVNLTINKGDSVGFVGETGSGKSTLLDLIMRLFSPTSGNLVVDNQAIDHNNSREWQSHIAHVPQSIYLFDSTIEENIAFGIPKGLIDHERVMQVAEYAQISDMINSLKDGYQTFVGERGIRLSGGQRQRIGIARALYKKADVLILDEATSALDSKTERMVIGALESLKTDITLLIIAHRVTTLKNCNKIFHLIGNDNISVINYEDIEKDDLHSKNQ